MLPARAPGRRKRGGEKDIVETLDIGRGEEARDRSGKGVGGTLATEEARRSRELRGLPRLGSPKVGPQKAVVPRAAKRRESHAVNENTQE